VTGSRQPTETDTSHTAATADGADLLTLHFKAVDGNGNAVTSTPVHYTTAVTDAGIVKDTLACMTNGSGECTSTVKTTKAGTYNVWVALVPAGAAQPVSPVKTALVFLAGDPVPSATTITTSPSKPRMYSGSKITISVTSKDAHGNVVPGWLLKNALRANTTSVNITVGTPVSNGTDEANVDLVLPKALFTNNHYIRTNVATVEVGPNVSKAVDASYVPYVSLCLAPDEKSSQDPDTVKGVYIGVSTWRLCYYDRNNQGKYTFAGYVPQSDENTYTASLTSSDFVDGDIVGTKLKFKTGLSWGNGVRHGADALKQGAKMRIEDTLPVDATRRLISNNANVFADSHDTDYGQLAPAPVGFFTGYSAWSSSDRDPGNMRASGDEICRFLNGGYGNGEQWSALPGADVFAANLDSAPPAAATVRVNTYGGGHDLIIYNAVPGDRGNGYYPYSGPNTGAYDVYGIWNKNNVTKETTNGTLTQDVQGAYCTAE
ncbi:Ig-like domain-containing protein, partial [Salmonella enterica]